MIIIRLNGGLGNQLFQYAHGRSLELSGKKIVFDISFFNGNKAKKDTERDFKLNNFDVETKAEFINKKSNFFCFLNKIKRKIGFRTETFYQSEKYFKDIAETIRQEFKLRQKMTPASEIVCEYIQKVMIPVSIHIRRGDYAQNAKTKKYHGECSPEYYKEALAILSEKLGQEFAGKISLFVFSDDIEWVRENMSFPYPTTFVSNPAIPDYEELILMSNCHHHIIANSSFSWWGAWLNPNPQKIVIAPEKWFNTKPSVYKDIVPNSWIKI